MPRRHLDEYTIIPRTSDMIWNEDGTFGERHLPYDASGGEQTIVTPKGNYYTKKGKQYKSDGYGRNTSDYYNGNDIIDFVNGTVLNPLQLTSPYHLLGVARHWDKNKGIGQIFDPNSGIVSENFAKEHPYLTAGINILGDAGTFGAVRPIRNASNWIGNIYRNKGFALVSPSRNNIMWIGKGLGSTISLEPSSVSRDWLRPAFINSTSPGTGRKLYDAAIKVARARGYNGVVSGEELLSAPKTYSTWKHYPNKILLGTYGTHGNNRMANYVYEAGNVNTVKDLLEATKNNVGATLHKAPVYGLTTPTTKVNTIGIPKFMLKKLQITSENAANITPEQWTAAQDAAIARGDMAEARRLRDLHFKVNAPEADVPDMYHGTHYENIGNSIHIGNAFRDNSNSNINFYTTPSRRYAREYGYNIYKFKVNAKTKDLKEGSFAYLPKRTVEELKDAGYKGTVDYESGPMLGGGLDAHEYTFFDPKQYKLADAVTYDDKGVRIPLGKRDNFNINDIRYAFIPTILGLGGYGAKRRLESNGKVSQ